jgi:hypothetical protein
MHVMVVAASQPNQYDLSGQNGRSDLVDKQIQLAMMLLFLFP